MTLENSVSITVSSLNPFDMPEIILEVLKYCNLNAIKSARLVNKVWETEANKIINKFIVNKFSDRYQNIFMTFKKLSKFIEIYNPKLVIMHKNFVLMDYNPNCYHWLEFMKNFGPYLKTLTITTSLWMEYMRNPGYYYNFANILQKTTCLTHLFIDIAIWNSQRWTTDQNSTYDLNLNSLRTLELLPINYESRKIPNSKSLWKGSEDWATEPVWSIVVNIIKSAPNLKTLNTTGGNFLPEAIAHQIFNNPLIYLETLLLGEFGTAEQLNFDFHEHVSNFFPLLCNKKIIKLTTVKLPRPYETSPTDWSVFFSRLSSTLAHLDVGEVSVKDKRLSTFDQPDLDQIYFNVPMKVLHTLIIHISMLSPLILTATNFPVLENVSVIVDVLDELESIFPDNYENEYGVENVLQTVSIAKFVFNDARPQHGEYPSAKRLFTTIRGCLPNIKTLEIHNWIGVDIMASLLIVFSQIAERIEAIYIKDLSYYGELSGQFLLLLTGVLLDESLVEEFNEYGRNLRVHEENLKCFKNLKKFSFGFDEYNSNFVIGPHFVENTIRHLHQLEYLEFIHCKIELSAVVELKSFPKLQFLHSKSIVDDPNEDDDDSDFEDPYNG